MSQPQTEEHYLASLVPPSVRATAGAGLGRRGFLKGAAGAGAPCRCPACSPPAAASATPARAAAAAAARADRHRDLRLQRLRRRAEEGLRRRRSRRSRREVRSVKTKVNTVDHNTFQEKSTATCRAARTTSSPGSPATGCGSSPRRASPATSATCGSKIGGDFSDAFKKASTGDDGKQYFVPFYNYPWALFYRKSVFAEHGYQPPKTLDELDDARRADEEGRPRPDRLRRQGRLAGDGHVRHPQHAHQRLRLPRQPDGRQGVVEDRQGQEGLRHLGAACCPTTRPARSAAPGRRPRSRWQQKKAGMYLLGTLRRPAVHRGADHDDLDFFAVPRGRLRASAPTRSRPRSTAS